MGHISKQERLGLEELFTAIEQRRYNSRMKSFYNYLAHTYKEHRHIIRRVYRMGKK